MFKKLFLTAMLASALALTTNAQKFYIKAGAGFAFKGASTTIGTESTYTLDANSMLSSLKPTSAKPLHRSYGRGFNFNISPGFNINKFVAVELDINYLAGTTSTTSKSTIIDANTNHSTSYIAEARLKNGIFLSPNIIISAGGEGKVKPYTRFGAAINVGGRIETAYIGKGTNMLSIWLDPIVMPWNGLSPGTYTETRTTETKLNTSLGFVGAVGVTLSINNKVSFYSELVSNNISVFNKSAEITNYELKTDGGVTRKLRDLTTYQRETIYLKELTASSNSDALETPNQDQAREDSRSKFNLSSIGLRIGVKIGFGS